MRTLGVIVADLGNYFPKLSVKSSFTQGDNFPARRPFEPRVNDSQITGGRKEKVISLESEDETVNLASS